MAEELHDIELKCAERGCGEVFLFEVGEQRFYAKQTPPFLPPRYCPKHRAEHKAAREARKQQEERAKLSPFNKDNWDNGFGKAEIST